MTQTLFIMDDLPGDVPQRQDTRRHVTSHFAHLDFLRASAVMLVFFSHFIGAVLTTASSGLGSAAHFGVLMFFVHTSLVLFMSLERMPSRSRWRRFCVRRFFRIYPLAVVTVAVMLFIGLPPATGLTSFHPTHRDIVANLFLVQNLTGDREILGTMWSLPFEVQMYVLLPVLFAVQQKIHPVIVWGAAVLLAEALLASHSKAGELSRYAPSFCGGFVAYGLVRGRRSVRVRFRLMPVALVAGVILFVLVGHFIGFSTIADSVAALGVGSLTGLVDGYIPSPILRICATIAKYSYGIYLSHLPIMMFCFGDRHTPTSFVSFAVLTVAVPVLLFHTIERPMIAAGMKLSNRIGRHTPRCQVQIS
jgi:peptidoglycan/LPS O-acetylase OafA/YrhL